MTLGEQIKQARESKNLSQEGLAARLEISRQAISKWENNTAIPRGINRDMLSKELGIVLAPEESIANKKKICIWRIAGWVVAAILAICLFISLFYIKTRLPEVNHSGDVHYIKLEYENEIKKIVQENAEVDDDEILVNVLLDSDNKIEVVSILLDIQYHLSSNAESKILNQVANKLSLTHENIAIVYADAGTDAAGTDTN